MVAKHSRSNRPPRRVAESRLPATIPAGEFKARCLALMDDIRTHGGEIVITKHGKPVAKLVPAEAPPSHVYGALRGSVIGYGDLITPVDDPWTADQDG